MDIEEVSDYDPKQDSEVGNNIFNNADLKKFPSYHEMKGIVELIDAIREKYKFIHPMNLNPIKMGNFVNIQDEKL